MSYEFSLENLETVYPEIEHLFREHYAEMCERLERDGLKTSPYNPRLDQYFAAGNDGWLLTFLTRCDGVAVGYANIYVTHDMHNRDLIAKEDTMFITKAHRNGVGRKMSLFGMEELRRRGVKRLNVTALTDLRVAKLWQRMGFKPVAQYLTYEF